jgi:hypothetical protein
MKQVQEELERERKEKEAAQAEVLLLKTKISELGYPPCLTLLASEESHVSLAFDDDNATHPEGRLKKWKNSASEMRSWCRPTRR